MRHWKLTLAYDGTPYHGWQVQPGLPTVQGTLARMIHRITGEEVLPQGSAKWRRFRSSRPSPAQTFTGR